MNIFATYSCPIKSARYLDNKRVIKMILESAQLLSSALHYHKLPAPYKSTHTNHPCTIWARENQTNYSWLLKHFRALMDEYSARYNRQHACEKHYEHFLNYMQQLPVSGITNFANCTENKIKGISFKYMTDTHLAYRKYLRARWKTDSRKPEWK